MKISEMSNSKYLKAHDVDPPKLVTIRTLEHVNVAQDGKPKEMKWILGFDELEKPMVLNKTNINRIARAVQSDDTDHWIGKKVVVYNDPDVEFGGEIVGGIRVRAPKGQAKPIEEDTIPF
jgi:hypothetical protein